ncbi:Rieske 2Fe-2S domain-containing protein [Dactylosporangium sp. CA-092794]|uniref:Rieske 2Fe-2S domain-containing protein n=1 Tax=Dactylosporangium sp. CA-092794 TaxID=3239929 RepID=UPI003D8DF2AF
MTTVAPPAPATEAPSPFQSGPGTPAGRYLRSYWQPVRLSEDLPRGQAQPLAVMGERFTLYRGANGRAVVMAPGCAHRLTRLSVGTVEDDAIRCLFHGWKFGPDGQCLEAPGQSPSLVRRTSVKTYPTREEHGLIFAYFGDGPEPRFPDIAGFSRTHGRDMMSALVVDNSTYRRNCNYYINVENALDIAHAPFTHRLSADPTATEVGFATKVGVIRDITVERTAIGVRVREIDDEGLPTESMVMLPNAMHLIVGQRNGTLEQIAWRVPIDDDAHMSFAITALHTDEEGARQYAAYRARQRELIAKYPPTEECAEQILRGEKTLRDFVDHPLLVNIEDHVAQMGMRFIADTGKENLAQSDKGVIQLRRMFMSRISDFLAGAPFGDSEW